MKQILLTQNQTAIVDDETFSKVNRYKWYARKDRNGYYAVRSVQGRTEYLHWVIIGKPRSGLIIDHKNGNTLDNRWSNLRICTRRENNQNTVHHRNGKLLGAHWNKKDKKWGASINLKGKLIWLGYFETPQEAHNKYIQKLEEALCPKHGKKLRHVSRKKVLIYRTMC